jgi:hypothetical protein
MPRPKPLEPKVRLHIVLRQQTFAKLRLIFFSSAHANGLLKGAVSDFIETAINEKLERAKGDLVNFTLQPTEREHDYTDKAG